MAVESVKVVTKSAGDTLPIWIDWSVWLASETTQLGLSVTLLTSMWESDDVTVLGSPAPELNGSVTSCWLSGGTVAWQGTLVTNTITTNRGHTISRAITVMVR